MKDKISHFIAAFIVLGISMMAITYMFYGKIDWIMTISFAIVMGIADVFIFKKMRERKK
ncbi:hypothetical protein [Avrilella dinanensis]|uniref:hypothetical protein n=1 Tax=Avrilella dinanensis TaxID=2008672 RepID=UPI0024094A64|nr:hypothetical protein [Avrilella dinanensis]